MVVPKERKASQVNLRGKKEIYNKRERKRSVIRERGRDEGIASVAVLSEASTVKFLTHVL